MSSVYFLPFHSTPVRTEIFPSYYEHGLPLRSVFVDCMVEILVFVPCILPKMLSTAPNNSNSYELVYHPSSLHYQSINYYMILFSPRHSAVAT